MAIGEPNILYCHVAQEQHKDGNTHLHIGLWCREAIRTRDPNYWDFVCNQHGNYQGMKYPKGVLQYISKDDKEPAVIGVPPPGLLSTKASGKLEQVAHLIKDGVSNATLIELYPAFMLMNSHRVKSFKHLAKVYLRHKPPFTPRSCEYVGTQAGMQTIAGWINDNIGVDRHFKQEQLFLWGPKNCMKTSLVKFIGNYINYYPLPTTEQFYDFYDDDEYDLIFIDEFYGTCMTLQAYNLWLQGDQMMVRIKGGQSMKYKNQPIITCSNYSPRDCYPNVTNGLALEAMECRLKVINVLAPLDLDNLYIMNKNWKGKLLRNITTIEGSAPVDAEADEGAEVLLETVMNRQEVPEARITTTQSFNDDELIHDIDSIDSPTPPSPPKLFDPSSSRKKRVKYNFLMDEAEVSGSDSSDGEVEEWEDLSDTEKAALSTFIQDDEDEVKVYEEEEDQE